MKFKVGDKVRVRENLVAGNRYGKEYFVNGMAKHKGKVFIIENILSEETYELEGIMFAWTNEMLEEVKEDFKEKKFREVIADIKEGEIWIQKDKGYIVSKIANFGGDIVIELDSPRSVFGTKGIYMLERKQHSFDEAFKAYENGKEIESIEYRYKKIDGQDMYSEKEYDDWDKIDTDELFITFNEIRGKWYIND